MIKNYIKCILHILKHKYFVFIQCCKFNIPIRGLLHDLSKFIPDEFFSYAKFNFLGVSRKVSKIDYGTLYHFHRNKHHWTYWVLILDSGEPCPLEMPEKYVYEMVADWIGAGRSKGNDLKYWYSKNKDRMILHDKTKDLIDKIIKERNLL